MKTKTKARRPQKLAISRFRIQEVGESASDEDVQSLTVEKISRNRDHMGGEMAFRTHWKF